MAVAMLVIGVGLEVHFAMARPSLESSRSFNPTPIDRTLNPARQRLGTDARDLGVLLRAISFGPA